MRHNVDALEKVSAALEEARLECEAINRDEQLFDWSMTQFPQLEAMMQAKDPYEKLWNTAYHFSLVSEQWLHGNSVLFFFLLLLLLPFRHSPMGVRQFRLVPSSRTALKPARLSSARPGPLA